MKSTKAIYALTWHAVDLAHNVPVFSFDDVRKRIPVSAFCLVSDNEMGPIMAGLHKRGIIRPVGAIMSNRPAARASLRKLWTIADSRKAAAFQAENPKPDLRDLGPDETLFDGLDDQAGAA